MTGPSQPPPQPSPQTFAPASSSFRKEEKRSWSLRGWLLVVTSAVMVSAILAFALFSFYLSPAKIVIPIPGSSSPITLNPGLPGEKVILVMGVDIGYDRSGERVDPAEFRGVRTDTMMLLRVSTSKKTVSIVSIPRDSKVYLGQGGNINKINSAFAIGGSDLAVRTIENSFGIPVDNFVVVNFQAVEDVVNALGGVRVYVEKPMKYRDRTAKLNIDFDPGHHDLSGQDAMAYMRFRHDALGDIGRVRRQQRFLTALSQKLKSPWALTKLPELVSIASNHIQTDLTQQELMQLAWFVKEVGVSKIRVATLPGRPSMQGISYWVISPEPAQQVLDRLILDNPSSYRQDADTQKPLKIGVLYDPELTERLPELLQSLPQETGEDANQDTLKAPFKLVCQREKVGATTQLVEHSRRVNDNWTQQIQSQIPGMDKARLIYAPVGSTFEENVCQHNEDYTLVLGKDL